LRLKFKIRKHEEWKEKTQIKGTPTVLVNGYKLPETYKVESVDEEDNPIIIIAY